MVHTTPADNPLTTLPTARIQTLGLKAIMIGPKTNPEQLIKAAPLLPCPSANRGAYRLPNSPPMEYMDVTNPYFPSFIGIQPGIHDGISRLAFLPVRHDMTYPGVFISPWMRSLARRLFADGVFYQMVTKLHGSETYCKSEE